MGNFIRKKLTSFSALLFLCIFTTSFILLAIGLVVLSSYSNTATSKVNNALMEQNLVVTKGNIEAGLREPDYLAPLALSQENFLTNLKHRYSKTSATYRSLHRVLVNTATSGTFVTNISLFDSWKNLISTETIFDIAPLNNLAECKEYFSNIPSSNYYTDNYQTWYFLQENPTQKGHSALANVREIQLNTSAENPWLVMYLSEDKLSAIYEFLGNGSYLVTQDGMIISAVNKELLGTVIDSHLLERISSLKSASSFSLMGKHYHAIDCPTIGCYLVVYSDSSLISDINRSTTLVTIIIIMAGLILSLIWSRIISATVTQPLRTLKSTMEKVQGGDLQIRNKTSSIDEFGYLSDTFNYMMDVINNHIQENNLQNALTKDAELRLLQAQINPHLLYNSLDSALHILNKDPEESIKVLEELSSFFKLSLQKGNKVVTIRDAITLADVYLKIQNSCRMKDYTLTVSGDKSIEESTILHMCLQPIIENSVLHGLEGNFASGNIEINLSRSSSGDIIIAIRDDGSGMMDDELSSLREQLLSRTPPNKGYGLWNVSQRIKMFYGNEYGVSIDSEFGEYTIVTLTIKDNNDRNENKSGEKKFEEQINV